MLLNRLSIRVSLIVTIVAMAALGLGLTVVSGRIYRDHALDNQRTALSEQLRVATDDARQRLDKRIGLLARDLVAQPIMTDGSIIPQRERLLKALDELRRRHSTGDGRSPLVALAIYDAQLVQLAQRNWPKSAADTKTQVACEHLTLGPGGGALPPSGAGYCLAGGRLYYGAYLPVGNPRAGYLGAVIDAVSDLASLENVLSLPLRITLSDGSVLARSPDWPADAASAGMLFASRTLDVHGGRSVTVQVAEDARALHAWFDQTEYAIFYAAGAVTLLFVLIALAVLDKTAVAPLRSLTNQLRQLRHDESQAGRRVTVHGNAEIVELAERFNEMTVKLEGLYENLERTAFTDLLTQLPNRNRLQDRLEEAIAAAQREVKSFALLMMDLDRFKEINNTLGHHVGDALLQQVAMRLRAKLRESDTIARMGGDEFAVLLPTVTRKQAEMAARMLLQALQTPFTIETHQLDVRTSMGVALYPDHGVDAQTLIQRADVAMYGAKQAGTGFMLYDPRKDRHHPAQLTLMGEVRQAVEQEQFVLYYQPKIGLKVNRVIGLEALVRWRHPSGKLIMPETFIPLLEQTGLIRRLTGWVTHEALRTARELRERGFALPIAVNISARDLHNYGLVEELAEQLALYNASAEWLELEITESAVMTDVARAMDVVSQLAGMGFKLVIDDFGTGYSSLAYLKRLPVHAMKIDKSFVMGMAKDGNDAAIVYTSIELSHSLGLQVVAEGVNDEAALFRLRARGCDAVQGLYLSRPLPAEELVDWLAKSTWGLQAEAAS